MKNLCYSLLKIFYIRVLFVSRDLLICRCLNISQACLVAQG